LSKPRDAVAEQEFEVPQRTQVTIKRNDPFDGRTTIYLTPAGSFTSKKLEVPSGPFLEACIKLAAEMERAADIAEEIGEPEGDE
jgi:hypothetical protein